MPSRPRIPRSGEMMILIAIGVLALIAVTGYWSRIIDLLYGPYAAFVAVIMLVEYIVLKGADRSRIYQRELHAARQRRKEDLLALRELDKRMVEWRAEIKAGAGVQENMAGENAQTDATLARIDAMLALIRERS